jgi:hypothetical protein
MSHFDSASELEEKDPLAAARLRGMKRRQEMVKAAVER